jgi:putative transposase
LTYLFAQEGIPRTTALYWIKNSQKYEGLQASKNQVLEAKVRNLENKLNYQKALTHLLVETRKLHPFAFDKKKVKAKAVKKQIISLLNESKELIPLNVALATIGLSPSTYYRWLSVFQKCELEGESCKKRKKNQLTVNEVKIMKHYVTSKKFSHIPIASLYLLAQRQDRLFCSLDTWYKYIQLFEWRRPKNKKFYKKDKIGLRASEPNQIWHIDVSQILFIGGRVFYFQAIIDNFSRYILAWSLNKEISAEHTVGLIKKANKTAIDLLSPKYSATLVSDGGSENTANIVAECIASVNMKRLIARQDIQFSNSMIEALFKSFKSNYFHYQKVRSEKDILRKIEFYVEQSNKVIPRQFLKGATPFETYTKAWGDQEVDLLKMKRLQAREKRMAQNLAPTCSVCN